MRKHKKKLKINPIAIISIIIIILLGYSFAKYVINTTSIHIQSAEKFYFNSNTLTEENTKYTLTDWDGKSAYTLSIDMKNYEDEFRYTNKNIEYSCQVVSNNNITITTSLNGETSILTGEQKSQETIDVVINPQQSLEEGNSVILEVIATSLAPYEKTISATFEIFVEETVEYEVNFIDEIDLEYAQLYIENYDSQKNLEITYDNTKCIIDTNNKLLNQTSIVENGTKSTVYVQMASNTNYCMIFIKKDTSQKLVLNTDVNITNN